MKPSWLFYNPVRIYFGINGLNNLNAFVKGKNITIISSHGSTIRGTIDHLKEILFDRNLAIFDNVNLPLDISWIDNLHAEVGQNKIDTIIAVGGGGIIDTGKAILLALKVGSENPLLYKNYFYDKVPLNAKHSIHFIAIPTTAGSGSEVTQFCTIWDKIAMQKHSLETSMIFSDVALIDPTLTISLPYETTLSSGCDALSHSFEAIWNMKTNPLSSLCAKKAINNILMFLLRVINNPSNLKYRIKMSKASLFAGLAFSNTQTSLAHAISYKLTLSLGIPHGLASSCIIPAILYEHGRTYSNLDLLGCAKENGCSSIQDFADLISRFYKQIGLPVVLKKYIPKFDTLYDIAINSVYEERSQNYMKPPSIEYIKKILELTHQILF